MTVLDYFSNTHTDTINLFDTLYHKPFLRRPNQTGLSVTPFAAAPSKTEVHKFIDDLFDFFFPTNQQLNFETAVRQKTLEKQLQRLLIPLTIDTDWVTAEFFSALPLLYTTLLEDANAVLDYDPAATSLVEVIVAYPGFYATAVYRIAHALFCLDVPVLPRTITEYAHSKTGIDIHPGAQIGRAFVIDHGTGIVIGATSIIGNYVKLFQGVTLGAKQVNKSLAHSKRHPTIEDHVTIYANATVLGGETVIGHHSILGGSVWLTRTIPPHSQVYNDSQVSITSINS